MLMTWKCSTLKASVNESWNLCCEVYQEIIVTVPNRSAVECLPRSKGQRLMKKASVMKELPSDIWHPLLLFSLNQQRETVEGGNSICQQAKRHGVPKRVVYMCFMLIFSNILDAHKNPLLRFVFVEE